MDSLWALWDAHFDQRPKHHHRTYLESRLAYRLQEHAFGGLSQGARKRLEKVGETGIVPRLSQREANWIFRPMRSHCSGAWEATIPGHGKPVL